MAEIREQGRCVGEQGGKEMGPLGKGKGEDAPASADLPAAGQRQTQA